jgi:hypothetical protein
MEESNLLRWKQELPFSCGLHPPDVTVILRPQQLNRNSFKTPGPINLGIMTAAVALVLKEDGKRF